VSSQQPSSAFAQLLKDITVLSDQELHQVISHASSEQHMRALESGDLEAVVKQGFAEGFKSDGMPLPPQEHDLYIVAFGAKIEKSATRHTCAFLSIEQEWVWESPHMLEHQIRPLPSSKGHNSMQCVSVVAKIEGLSMDFVESKTLQAVHQLLKVDSFTVSEGVLESVGSRSLAKVRPH